MNFIGEFSFRSSSNRYLQSYTFGEMHAFKEDIGIEERWFVYAWDDGQISLQNFRTNRWLSAKVNGHAICNNLNPGPEETWRLYGNRERVALLSSHGKWLSAWKPFVNAKFGGEIIAETPNCRECEHWSMTPVDGENSIGDRRYWEQINFLMCINMTDTFKEIGVISCGFTR